MMMSRVRKIGYTGMAALFLTGSLLAAVPAAPQNVVAVEASAWDFQGEAASSLKEIQTLSGKLRVDADRLASFPRSGMSWQSHAYKLDAVRGHINLIGERLTRLQEIRAVASPLQQQAINRVVPMAAELASHTEAAIGHLNEHRGHLFAPAYRDHLQAIAGGAEEMKASLDNFWEYSSTQQKLDRLQEKLEG